MFKAWTLSLHLGMFALAMALPAGHAFSQTVNSTAPVTELTLTDTKVGTGEEAVAGKMATVHYTGWLYTYNPAKPDHRGRQFDSSLKSGQPFSFPLGAGRVIKGWDQGVAGMKVGGQRTLTIPSEMAYGARGAGRAIPPNMALIFDVELLEVK